LNRCFPPGQALRFFDVRETLLKHDALGFSVACDDHGGQTLRVLQLSIVARLLAKCVEVPRIRPISRGNLLSPLVRTSMKSGKTQMALSSGMMGHAATERALWAMRDSLEDQEFRSTEEASKYLSRQVQTPAKQLKLFNFIDPRRQALELTFDAREGDPHRRLELARQALEIDPLCADAYLILAAGLDSRNEARPLLLKALEVAEISLGREWFAGEPFPFWDALETRPYMRARAALAKTLYELGEIGPAISHYVQMLELNPNDNQGVRHELVAWLIEENRDAEAFQLLDRYREDDTGFFAYAVALLCFRQCGDIECSREWLNLALGANSFVPEVLAEHELPPMPAYFLLGERDEAIVILRTQLRAWVKSEGATAWFVRHLERIAEEERKRINRVFSYKSLKRGEYLLA
jgi:tetratricopeptide (TPR) repeat protein